VHTHIGGFLYGFPAAFRTGIPLIHTVHNDPRCEVSPVVRRMHTQAYRLGAHGVVLSERFVGSFREVHARTPIGVVWNGIDTSRIATSRPEVSDTQRGSFRIVTVGRLEKQKRIDVFLTALADFARSSPVHVEARILGSGSQRDDLKALVPGLEIEQIADFRGRVGDVRRHLEWADAFASTSDYEGMPLAIVEAMASGLPVVATRVGAVPDLVLDGTTGILVDRRDPQAFATSLGRLARDTELRETMGNAGRDRSRMFNVEAMVGGYESVYARVRAPDA
jgi:glycosyltransferase involved in cell wall biosynthesis